MQASEYASYDGLGLAQLVRDGEVTPQELADAALGAIEAVNPDINAVIALTEEETEASLARYASGDTEGEPFAGVPFLIKDVGMHYAGVPCEMGSRLCNGFVLPHDTELAARFKRAGVVTLGRTNTPEFGNNATTEPLANGPTRNPWNTGRVPGGSSGGTAAAVAARMVPLGHGNDGGGSIRIPAACCGVFGLKPSRGRLPWGPDMDEGIYGMGNEHVLTRTVRDSAAMLDATEGPDVGTRILLPRPERPYLVDAGQDPEPLRIGFSTKAFAGGPDIDPECAAAVEATATLCEELGHTVTEGAPAISHGDPGKVFLYLANMFFGTAIPAVEALTGRTADADTLEATTQKCIEFGRAASALDIARTYEVINAITRASGQFFEAYDVWLSPVTASPPIELGILNANDPDLSAEEWIDKVFRWAPMTAAFNVTGQPGMSIPLHTSRDGLPLGMQFVGRLGGEATLLSLAGQLERALPWIDRRPGVCAG